MLRWLATKRTNLPFLAPLSTDATVNVTVSGVVTVVAGAFAVLVFVDVVMMTFLSCWTLFLFFFYFLSVGLRTTQAWGRKTNEKSCCSFAWILLWEPVIVPFIHFITDCAYVIISVSDEEAVITLIVLTDEHLLWVCVIKPINFILKLS